MSLEQSIIVLAKEGMRSTDYFLLMEQWTVHVACFAPLWTEGKVHPVETKTLCLKAT